MARIEVLFKKVSEKITEALAKEELSEEEQTSYGELASLLKLTSEISIETVKERLEILDIDLRSIRSDPSKKSFTLVVTAAHIRELMADIFPDKIPLSYIAVKKTLFDFDKVIEQIIPEEALLVLYKGSAQMGTVLVPTVDNIREVLALFKVQIADIPITYNAQQKTFSIFMNEHNFKKLITRDDIQEHFLKQTRAPMEQVQFRQIPHPATDRDPSLSWQKITISNSKKDMLYQELALLNLKPQTDEKSLGNVLKLLGLHPHFIIIESGKDQVTLSLPDRQRLETIIKNYTIKFNIIIDIREKLATAVAKYDPKTATRKDRFKASMNTKLTQAKFQSAVKMLTIIENSTVPLVERIEQLKNQLASLKGQTVDDGTFRSKVIVDILTLIAKWQTSLDEVTAICSSASVPDSSNSEKDLKHMCDIMSRVSQETTISGNKKLQQLTFSQEDAQYLKQLLAILARYGINSVQRDTTTKMYLSIDFQQYQEFAAKIGIEIPVPITSYTASSTSSYLSTTLGSSTATSASSYFSTSLDSSSSASSTSTISATEPVKIQTLTQAMAIKIYQAAEAKDDTNKETLRNLRNAGDDTNPQPDKFLAALNMIGITLEQDKESVIKYNSNKNGFIVKVKNSTWQAMQVIPKQILGAGSSASTQLSCQS